MIADGKGILQWIQDKRETEHGAETGYDIHTSIKE